MGHQPTKKLQATSWVFWCLDAKFFAKTQCTPEIWATTLNAKCMHMQTPYMLFLYLFTQLIGQHQQGKDVLSIIHPHVIMNHCK
jgi:hypothetical protein